MPDYLNDQQIDSELIIGLVCAVGSETSLVIDLLTERLSCAGYNVLIVKISRDVIPLLCDVPKDDIDKYQWISKLMDAGNEALREGRKRCCAGVGSRHPDSFGTEEQGDGASTRVMQDRDHYRFIETA